jgi:hypothetical protein
MRHSTIAAVVLAIGALVVPAAAAGGHQDQRHVTVVDDEGNQRTALMHWNVVVHERGDAVTGANGTLRVIYDDTGETRIWRVTGAEGHVPGAADADRQAFLRLLLTPVGPADASGSTATVRYMQPASVGRTGRVKVQFAWDIEGVGSISATGDMVIKGKKILQN